TSGAKRSTTSSASSCSLAGDARALELVEVAPREPLEHALEVGHVATPHEAHERGLTVLDVGRHTEDAAVVDALGVLLLQRLQRASAPRLFRDRIGVEDGRANRLLQQ